MNTETVACGSSPVAGETVVVRALGRALREVQTDASGEIQLALLSDVPESVLRDLGAAEITLLHGAAVLNVPLEQARQVWSEQEFRRLDQRDEEALELFARTFPDSPHTSQVVRLRDTIRLPTVVADFDRAVSAQDLATARSSFRQLERMGAAVVELAPYAARYAALRNLLSVRRFTAAFERAMTDRDLAGAERALEQLEGMGPNLVSELSSYRIRHNGLRANLNVQQERLARRTRIEHAANLRTQRRAAAETGAVWTPRLVGCWTESNTSPHVDCFYASGRLNHSWSRGTVSGRWRWVDAQTYEIALVDPDNGRTVVQRYRIEEYRDGTPPLLTLRLLERGAGTAIVYRIR